jgi:NifU-like protein involved in Fe-S cluster formation
VSDPLYRRELLRLAADAHGAGRLSNPDATGSAFNPSCGDRVTVDLTLVDDRIQALAHETRACVLSQASAAILASSLTGKNESDVRALRADVVAMLTGDGPAPAMPFQAYAAFDGVCEHTARHRCVLLPFEAVLSAFDSIG